MEDTNNVSNLEQDFDEKYQTKSEIDHVLDRPGTYVGSRNTEVIQYPLFVPSKNKIQMLQNIGYNEALLKLVDEIISNSVDEHRDQDALFRVNEIWVEVNMDGTVSIRDNGGIPVRLHKGTGLLIPEMIFGRLRTSSNYDDNKERTKVGTNGLGAKLTNIFSKEFSVQTCDGKNSVMIQWQNNMKEIINKDLEKYPKTGGYLIIPENNQDGKNHGSLFKFKIDLERFELEDIPVSTIRIMQKRCIDACATNPGLIVHFKSDAVEGKLDSTWQFNSFDEYIKIYLNEDQIKTMMVYPTKKDMIIIVPENIGLQFGFVNGATCSNGTHYDKVEKQLTEKLLDICKRNDMALITEKDILNRISIFINATIINPEYASQTKEKLTNKKDRISLNFSKEFLEGLKDSPIFQALKDYYEIKYAEEKRKENRKLNAAIKTTKSKKLIECASKTANNELWLFEGTSASNGFRKHRNLIQSAYLLRGKITNTFNLKRTQILENQELREIIAGLGILFDEPMKNVKNCLYKKIIIASDMDHDGHHICGLLIAFFAKHFPELVKAGYLYRAISPIIIVANLKTKEKNYYYTTEDYHKDEHKYSSKNHEIIYTKGLGGLADEDYRQMLRNQKLVRFMIKDSDDMEAISIWFDQSTELRKKLILEDSGMFEEAC